MKKPNERTEDKERSDSEYDSLECAIAAMQAYFNTMVDSYRQTGYERSQILTLQLRGTEASRQG